MDYMDTILILILQKHHEIRLVSNVRLLVKKYQLAILYAKDCEFSYPEKIQLDFCLSYNKLKSKI